MCVLTILLVLILVLTLKYYFELKLRSFWVNTGIKSATGVFNVFGVLKFMCRTTNFSSVIKEFYDEYKNKTEVVGINFAGSPIVLVTSPDLAKLILVDDAEYFGERGFHCDKQSISTNLFTCRVDECNRLRNYLLPPLSLVDHETIHDHMGVFAGSQFIPYLEPDAKFHRDIDMAEFMERYTTHLVGQHLFEIYCYPVLNPDTELRLVGKLLNTRTYRDTKILAYLFPNHFLRKDVKVTDSAVNEFFMRKLNEIVIVHSRVYGSGKRFFIELFKVMKWSSHPNYLSMNEVAAYCAQILEASNKMSMTMSYILYELALNQDIQDELREEISTVYYRDNFGFRYESIGAITNLDRIVCETLRKYPPLSMIHRIATRSYRLPHSGGVIPKGTRVIIPTLGFQNDPKYFQNPDDFDPDRFKCDPHPFTYMPFGLGASMCPGTKLVMHNMKLGIAYLIRCYRFDVCDKTAVPLKLDPRGVWRVPENGVWLSISKAR